MSDRPTDACEGLRKSKDIDQPTVGSLIVMVRCYSCLSDRPMCH